MKMKPVTEGVEAKEKNANGKEMPKGYLRLGSEAERKVLGTRNPWRLGRETAD